MSCKHVFTPLAGVFVLLVMLTACAQKDGDKSTGSAVLVATPAGGEVWKKQVIRVVDLREADDTLNKTAKHQLKDVTPDSTMLVALLVRAINTGKVSAYKSVENGFNDKISDADFKLLTGPKYDTEIVEDPTTGAEKKVATTTEFNQQELHKFRILESWAYNPATGKTEIQQLGIGPVMALYMSDGTLLGEKSLFWVKLDEIHDVLATYAQFHPKNSLAYHTWDDYFLNESRPKALN